MCGGGNKAIFDMKFKEFISPTLWVKCSIMIKKGSKKKY